jgi:hypothetical protein
VTDAFVWAGSTFGPDNLVETSDDTHVAAELKKISVKGAVNGTRFHAGVDTIGTTLAGGKIGSITVGGPADVTSVFAAETLPRTAKLDGVQVVTATDPRFESAA